MKSFFPESKKRFFSLFLAVLTIFIALSSQMSFAEPSYSESADGKYPSVSAERAVLISCEDKSVLYEKNSRTRAGMASTTKIMTGLLAAEYIEKVGLEKPVTVDAEAVGIEGSSVYLKKGEVLLLKDLLYSTMLASANDAAAALAIEISGSIEAFVEKMNQKAEELGLSDTHFENPHGLSDENHYTTAYDLAILSAYAMEKGIFRDAVSMKSYTFKTEGMTRSVSNHNRLLFSYDGAIGVKTGFTKATGRCLVTAAERDGVRLIAVTLNAPDDWQDHREMLDFGFSRLKRVTLVRAGEFSCSIPVVNGKKASVICENTADIAATVDSFTCDSEKITVRTELPRFVYADIEKGEVLGSLLFIYEGEIIARVDITAVEASPSIAYEKSTKEKIAEIFGK